jgi:ribonucleoside-diphosphate reductase beta chain
MEPIYQAKCPFDFMLKQDIIELTSFFERTTSSYTSGVGGDVSLDEEF